MLRVFGRWMVLACTFALLLTPLGSVPAAAMQVGTDEGSLAALLRQMPHSPLGRYDEMHYADYARQREALGLTGRPEAGDEDKEWLTALRGMVMPLDGAVATPEWREGFGFDVWDLDQMLMFGGSDRQLTILRGRFDVEAIEASLSASGYAERKVDDGTYLSWGEDHESTSATR